MILLKNLYENKTVCLLGGGDSVSKFFIDFNSYDLVVGINRIYKTNYYKHINVLYHGLGIADWKNVLPMINLIKQCDNIEYLIACPWNKKRIGKIKDILTKIDFFENKKFICCRNILRECIVRKKRPLTGMAVLNHIILSKAAKVDIYGFDFYEAGYVGGIQSFDPRKYHDLDANKEFLGNLIVKYPGKINWFL
jgi:hypothetical protein